MVVSASRDQRTELLKRQFLENRAGAQARRRRDEVCAAIETDRRAAERSERLLAASEAFGIDSASLREAFQANTDPESDNGCEITSGTDFAQPPLQLTDATSGDCRTVARNGRLAAASDALGMDADSGLSRKPGQAPRVEPSDIEFIRRFARPSSPSDEVVGGASSDAKASWINGPPHAMPTALDAPSLRSKSTAVAAAALLGASGPAPGNAAGRAPERQSLLPGPLSNHRQAKDIMARRAGHSTLQAVGSDLEDVHRRVLESVEAAGLFVPASKSSGSTAQPSGVTYGESGVPIGVRPNEGKTVDWADLMKEPINNSNKSLNGDALKTSGNLLAGATSQLRIGSDTMRLREPANVERLGVQLEDEKFRANQRAAQLNSVLAGLGGSSNEKCSAGAAQLTHSHWSGMPLGGRLPRAGAAVPANGLQRVAEESELSPPRRAVSPLAKFVEQAGKAAVDGVGRMEQLRHEGARIKRFAEELSQDSRRSAPPKHKVLAGEHALEPLSQAHPSWKTPLRQHAARSGDIQESSPKENHGDDFGGSSHARAALPTPASAVAPDHKRAPIAEVDWLAHEKVCWLASWRDWSSDADVDEVGSAGW